MVGWQFQLLGLLSLTVVVVGMAAIAYVVYRDARDVGSDAPYSWGVLTGSVPFGLFIYLLYRPRMGERTRPLDRRERAATSVAFAFVGSFIAGAIVSPPDPYTQIVWGLAALPVGLLCGYLLFWRRGWRRVRSSLTT